MTVAFSISMAITSPPSDVARCPLESQFIALWAPVYSRRTSPLRAPVAAV